jgi:hypothetical protein
MKKAILIALVTFSLNIAAFAQQGERSKDVADRIRGDAVRNENRGDRAGAREARDAANRAERSTPERAREIERDYNRGDRSDRGGRGPAGGRP